jgi:hypothetical protein
MKEQILELFEDGDRTLIAVDIAELSRIFADDYVQYESGRAFSKQNVVNNLSSSAIRYISLRSTGRRIRITGRRRGNRPRLGRGRNRARREALSGPLCLHGYTDIVMRRDGKWQIVASQPARPVEAQAES